MDTVCTTNTVRLKLNFCSSSSPPPTKTNTTIQTETQNNRVLTDTRSRSPKTNPDCWAHCFRSLGKHVSMIRDTHHAAVDHHRLSTFRPVRVVFPLAAAKRRNEQTMLIISWRFFAIKGIIDFSTFYLRG